MGAGLPWAAVVAACIALIFAVWCLILWRANVRLDRELDQADRNYVAATSELGRARAYIAGIAKGRDLERRPATHRAPEPPRRTAPDPALTRTEVLPQIP